jgi:hypothetical protein
VLDIDSNCANPEEWALTGLRNFSLNWEMSFLHLTSSRERNTTVCEHVLWALETSWIAPGDRKV